MKTLTSITKKIIQSLVLFPLLFTLSCEQSPDEDILPVLYIENLSMENYPKVNGSTSTEPLQVLIACKLLEVDYAWVYTSFWYKYTYRLMPSCDKKPEVGRYITEKINHAGTHGSFEQLIYKKADLILTARTASDEENHLADSLNVELIESPIALDAFVFLNNIHNPVNALTTKEIQDIYTGQLISWGEVGGDNNPISAFQRNANSGSQELMKSLVMGDLPMIDSPDMIMYGMMGLINAIEFDKMGLGYSVNYYTEKMVRSDSVKLLAVNGVFPEYNSLRSREYIYTTIVYAIIREDLDTSSSAYKLFELLQESPGQNVIRESGYIPFY